MHYITILSVLVLLLAAGSAQENEAYSEADAKMYLYASSLAYCDSHLVLSGGCKSATKLVRDNGMEPLATHWNNNEKEPIHIVILKRAAAKEFIIAFSGTKGSDMLINEIKGSKPVKYTLHPEVSRAQVFDYFYSNYVQDFRDVLQGFIQKYVDNDPDHRVVFTGHSLGGALTLHAAVDSILSKWIDKSRVLIYTYGQPRVGNTEFNGVLKSGTRGVFRVVHNKDLVAHIPPCMPKLGSNECLENGLIIIFPFHPAREIWYDAGMNTYIECSASNGEDPNCSNSIKPISVTDHTVYFGINVGSAHTVGSTISELLTSTIKEAIF